MMMEKTRDTRTIGVAIIRLNGITIKSQCRSKFDNREFEQDNEVRSRERKLAAGVWGEQSTLQVFVWREM